MLNFSKFVLIIKFIYISEGLRENTFSENSYFCVNYSFKTYNYIYTISLSSWNQVKTIKASQIRICIDSKMYGKVFWKVWMKGSTFEVQVAGSIGVLRDRAGVDLERVHVAVIAGHHHVVPLVVIERLVGVALHERRPIAQVKNIMDVPEIHQFPCQSNSPMESGNPL